MTNDSATSSPCPDGNRRPLRLQSLGTAADHVLIPLQHAELVRADVTDVLLLFFAGVPADPASLTYSLTLRALELHHN